MLDRLPSTASPMLEGDRAGLNAHVFRASEQVRVRYGSAARNTHWRASQAAVPVPHAGSRLASVHPTPRSLSTDTGDYVPGDEPSRSANFVFRVIDDMVESRPMIDGDAVSVDGGRIYVTGHAMGGFGTWDFLIRRPTFFTAGVPMAGYQDHESAALVAEVPIWAFHHQIDSYNALHSDTMQSLIEAAGGTKMKLTKLMFDTGGQGDQAHFQTPAAAWNDEPGLFEWIFSKARARP
jgi:hypothetical protein